MRPIGTVYEIRNKRGTVLYVGKSLEFFGRINQHKPQPWWTEAQSIELHHCYGTIHDLGELEADLIRTLLPEYNKALIPNRLDH